MYIKFCSNCITVRKFNDYNAIHRSTSRSSYSMCYKKREPASGYISIIHASCDKIITACDNQRYSELIYLAGDNMQGCIKLGCLGILLLLTLIQHASAVVIRCKLYTPCILHINYVLILLYNHVTLNQMALHALMSAWLLAVPEPCMVTN